MEGKNQNIRIAWFFDNFPNPYQVYIKNLLLNLKRLYGLNISVVTYRLNGSKNDFDFPVEIVKADSWLLRKMKGILKRKLNPDEKILSKYSIVHLQHSFMYPFVMGLATEERKPKLLITFRGGDSYIKPWIKKKWLNYHSEIAERFDAIQVMSDDQKLYLRKWGYTLEKIHVIPISTSTSSSFFVQNEIGKELRICSVFRMIWEKNIEANLRLIKLLVKRGLKVKYDVYGDGVDFGQLYYLTDRFGLADVVRIHGRVDPIVLNEEISKCHLLLQLSSSEALPASAIEALSFGIPCVVSDVGGFPEIIKNDFNGYLMDFDAYDLNGAAGFVERVVSDNMYYQKLKKGAFQSFNDNFSPEVEARKVYAMYCSMLGLS